MQISFTPYINIQKSIWPQKIKMALTDKGEIPLANLPEEPKKWASVLIQLCQHMKKLDTKNSDDDFAIHLVLDTAYKVMAIAHEKKNISSLQYYRVQCFMYHYFPSIERNLPSSDLYLRAKEQREAAELVEVPTTVETAEEAKFKKLMAEGPDEEKLARLREALKLLEWKPLARFCWQKIVQSLGVAKEKLMANDAWTAEDQNWQTIESFITKAIQEKQYQLLEKISDQWQDSNGIRIFTVNQDETFTFYYPKSLKNNLFSCAVMQLLSAKISCLTFQSYAGCTDFLSRAVANLPRLTTLVLSFTTDAMLEIFIEQLIKKGPNCKNIVFPNFKKFNHFIDLTLDLISKNIKFDNLLIVQDRAKFTNVKFEFSKLSTNVFFQTSLLGFYEQINDNSFLFLNAVREQALIFDYSSNAKKNIFTAHPIPPENKEFHFYATQNELLTDKALMTQFSKRITTLTLKNCPNIKKEGWSWLLKNANLRNISLLNCSGLDSQDMSLIGVQRKLETIVLDTMKLDERTSLAICRDRKIKCHIKFINCEGISPEWAEQLKKSSSFIYLEYSNTSMPSSKTSVKHPMLSEPSNSQQNKKQKIDDNN